MIKVSAGKNPPKSISPPCQEPHYLRPRSLSETFYPITSPHLSKICLFRARHFHHKVLLFQDIVRVQQPIRSRNCSQSFEPLGRARQSASLFQPRGGDCCWRGGSSPCRKEGELWEWLLHSHIKRKNHINLRQCFPLNHNVNHEEAGRVVSFCSPTLRGRNPNQP